MRRKNKSCTPLFAPGKSNMGLTFEILMWMALMGYLGRVLDELFILPSALRCVFQK